MGVEFTQTTLEHRALLEKFLGKLTENRETLPELMVEPEGLETEALENSTDSASSNLQDDALISLFRSQPALPAEAFLAELRKQRGLAAAATV